jgi:transcriptional regulator with XRE-family HTH domain
MTKGSKKVSNRHWSVKEKARALRAKGLSYKEICKRVPVAKSTISLWCRDVPLSTAQKNRLWQKRDTQLKGIKAIQRMFWKRRCEAFSAGTKMIMTLKRDERFIAGLMLYWGEGTKQKRTSIANSDPRVIQFMVRWFNDFFDVTPDEMSMHVHMHSGQNENAIKSYWSELTGVPLENFHKSFTKPEGSGYRKNVLYKGTVKLTVKREGSTYMLFQILGCIAGFLNMHIGEKIDPEQWMEKLPYA